MATVAANPETQRFEQLVLDFLAYLEFERGLSRNTLEAYRSDLLQYGALPGERRGVGARCRARRRRRLPRPRWPPAGGGRPASPATIHRKSACLRSFYRHLRRDGLRESDPTAALSAPRRSRKLPARAHARRGGEAAAQPRGSEPAALRDRALLELMYACGLRASEAIGLEVVDVDLEERVLRARGKGSKERVVPIGQAAARAVGAYLERGRPALVKGRPEPHLFVNFRGVVAHPPGALQDRPPARPDRRAWPTA